ncbi:MAG: TonB-dependent receptor [Dysgonamonadaceae bacterium]|jgi:iron complex outermembrane receptor protein|nr:TonB-dependent receptor [Dysgonamonadaceae bacterium]
MKEKQWFHERHYRFKRFARKAYSAFNSMHKVVSIGVVAGCVLTFAHATQASAQSRTVSTPDSLVREQELDELVVTSSKAELTLQQTAKLVTVITRAEIERQPAQTLADLLKNVAGVDVRQRGGAGVQTDISVRGGAFDQIAILLNGANLTNPHTGHYSMDLPINLSDIDHIEIIQGPASLLYGAGAFAGGINIVTKKDSDTGLSFQAEGGMYELWGTELRGALKTASSSHSLSAGYHASAGYRPDSDYKILNTLWQSHFQEENAQLDIQCGVNDKAYGANTFYSPSYLNQFDDTQTLFVAVRGEAGTKLKFIPQIYWNRHYDSFQLYRDGTPDIPDWYKGHNYHYSDVFGFTLNTRYQWKGGITNWGGEIRNEGIFSNKLGKDTVNLGKYIVRDNRTNVSYFLEHTCLFRGFTLGAGLLANYNTAFSHTVDFYPNIHAAYWLSGRTKIFASWNNATRTPTFTDLYYAAPDLQGFADLQPEKSESYELGIQYRRSSLSLSANAFYEKGKNVIDWIRENPEDKDYQATNLTSIEKTGLETNFAWNVGASVPRLPATKLNLGYMYIYQTRDAGPWISNYVMDYLKHKFTAGLTHPVYKGVTADWQFRWQDRAGTYTRYENAQKLNEEPYPPFALLDLKLLWKKDLLSFSVTANNLFNVAYYDRGNIPQPGFWLIGGVQWTIR